MSPYVFPCVSDVGEVHAAGILCGLTGERLSYEAAASLGIPSVLSAFARLNIAPLSPTIVWTLSISPTLAHGHSGQLSALFALVKSQCRGSSLRRALGRGAVIWASAKVSLDQTMERALVNPLGDAGKDHDSRHFDKKVSAFLMSDAEYFFCAEEDADRVRGRLINRDAIVSLDRFTEIMESGKGVDQSHTIVSLQPWDLLRLVHVLFDKIPSAESDATVMVLRVEAEAASAIVRRVGTAGKAEDLFVRHADASAFVFAIFRSLDVAVMSATALASDSTFSADTRIALRTGRLSWDHRTPQCALFREAMQLAALGMSGVVVVSASELVRLRDAGRPLRGWLLGRRALAGEHGRSDVYALASSNDAPALSLDAIGDHPRSVLAVVLACGLTLSRLPLGGAAAWLLVQGQYGIALRLYVAGIVTDVLDGFIARSLNGETAWGKRYDGVIDTAFYWVVTLGFVVGGVVRGESLLNASLPLILVLVTLAATFWFEPYSEFYKYRSLVNRSWVLLCLLPRLSWNDADVMLVVLLGLMGLIGVVYEWKETQKEIASGWRGRGWRRSPVAPLAAYHRMLLSAQRALVHRWPGSRQRNGFF